MEDRETFTDCMEGQSVQSVILTGKNEALLATMMELAQTRDELERAQETKTQSWLDSKPIIDELEKLQSELTQTKNRISMATSAIATLESELEATNASTRCKEDEELKARMAIDEMGRILEQTQSEMDKLKVETGKERRVRAKLKKELRLRRQTLRTLQLMRRAAGMEKDAFGESSTAALHHIKQSKEETAFVELSHKEYYALRRKADDENSLADWRVSVSTEQRQIAKASSEEALRRLGMLYSENQSRKRQRNIDGFNEEGRATQKAAKEEIGSSTQPGNKTIRRSTSLQDRHMQARVKEKSTTDRGNAQERMRRSTSTSNKKIVKKKKPCILHQIRSFLTRSIKKFFG